MDGAYTWHAHMNDLHTIWHHQGWYRLYAYTYAHTYTNMVFYIRPNVSIHSSFDLLKNRKKLRL